MSRRLEELVKKGDATRLPVIRTRAAEGKLLTGIIDKCAEKGGLTSCKGINFRNRQERAYGTILRLASGIV